MKHLIDHILKNHFYVSIKILDTGTKHFSLSRCIKMFQNNSKPESNLTHI